MKLRLARWTHRLERLAARAMPAREAKVIETYVGYATPEHLVVRGRVLARRTGSPVEPGQGRLENISEMLRLFLTAEVPGVPVTCEGVAVKTDEEGYFRLELPRGAAEGWEERRVEAGGASAVARIYVPSPDAAFGIISDIDDTMMHTGAHALRSNLWNSLTGNYQTREVFSDAVALMQRFEAGERNPVFFVSSSPWNLYAFLRRVFGRNGLPLGPMFLRDYGIDDTKFITSTHGDHKGEAIDTILAANPGLPFVLIGDTGQHDAHVYRDAIHRHPGRVKEVIFRTPVEEFDAEIVERIREIEAEGVPVHVGPDYFPVLDRASPDTVQIDAPEGATG